jgi:hypothetical protein
MHIIPQETPDSSSRFWSKVRKTDTCWFWIGAHNNQGYGDVKLGGRNFTAHRVAYTWTRGPIPNGMTIDHLCRVPACVNPSHMEPVTMRVNILRGVSIIARHAVATHCPNGHEYDEVNTYVYPSGSRGCRACGRVRKAARRAERRKDRLARGKKR